MLPPMTEPTNLRPATAAEEIAHAIAFALQYEGRKRVHHADALMAIITAERLVRHLEQAGFRVDEAAGCAGYQCGDAGSSPGLMLPCWRLCRSIS